MLNSICRREQKHSIYNTFRQICYHEAQLKGDQLMTEEIRSRFQALIEEELHIIALKSKDNIN